MQFGISCVGCKKWHSKCDKQVPSCSQCAQRKIECVYQPRKKRKRGQAEWSIETDFSNVQEPANSSSSSSNNPSPPSSVLQHSQPNVLQNELSKLHLPPAYLQINTELIQQFLTHLQTNLPHVSYIEKYIRSFVQYYYSIISTTENYNNSSIHYVKIAYLLSLQCFVCGRKHEIESAKLYMQNCLTLVQLANQNNQIEWFNQTDENASSVLNNTLLALLWCNILTMSFHIHGNIKNTGVMLSYMKSYVSHQQALEKISKTTKQNFSQDDSIFSEVETRGIVLLLEHASKHFEVGCAMHDDSYYNGCSVNNITGLYLELARYRISKEQREIVPNPTPKPILQAVLLDLNSLKNSLDNLELLEGFSVEPEVIEKQVLHIVNEFEKVANTFYTAWCASPVFGTCAFLVSIRGLKVRFLHEELEKPSWVDDTRQLLDYELKLSCWRIVELLSSINFSTSTFRTLRALAKRFGLLSMNTLLRYKANDNSSTEEREWWEKVKKQSVDVIEKLCQCGYGNDAAVKSLMQEFSSPTTTTIEDNMDVIFPVGSAFLSFTTSPLFFHNQSEEEQRGFNNFFV